MMSSLAARLENLSIKPDSDTSVTNLEYLACFD